MSRIGKAPIELPTGVDFKVSGSKVVVKGPKGQLERETHHSVDVAVEGNVVTVIPKSDDVSNFWGLTRSH